MDVLFMWLVVLGLLIIVAALLLQMFIPKSGGSNSADLEN